MAIIRNKFKYGLLAAALLLMPMHLGLAVSYTYNSAQADGDLIKFAASNNVYIVKIYGGKRFKRLILNPAIFNQYDHLRWENIQLVSQDVFDSYITSNLVRLDNDTRVWKLYPNGDTGNKRWVQSAQQLASLNCDSDAIYVINIFEFNSYVSDSGILDQCPSAMNSGATNSQGIVLDSSSANGESSGTVSAGNFNFNDQPFWGEYYDIPPGASFPPQFHVSWHLARVDQEINFDWGLNAPLAGVGADNFAVRWSKSIYFPAGTYTFSFTGKDGFRVWTGDKLIIDKWLDQAESTYSADFVSSGSISPIKIEYYNHIGQAKAKLSVTKR